MHPFAAIFGFRNAYAPVDVDKVLLLSSSHKSKNFLKCELIQTKRQFELLGKQNIDLGEYLDSNHDLSLVLKDGNVTYFAAFSKPSYGQEVCTVRRVLLLQSTYSGD